MSFESHHLLHRFSIFNVIRKGTEIFAGMELDIRMLLLQKWRKYEGTNESLFAKMQRLLATSCLESNVDQALSYFCWFQCIQYRKMYIFHYTVLKYILLKFLFKLKILA